ncbi:uncharacterized protein LOC115737650 isoform X2 [Rhodamnia argentea]|uniref:Uncharacterized protein LOC115737650 isoform X2 n=1 Tax=Rhodamnia argentea TaxID=178133 RepID=A0ABM3HQN9_9MYRT|nr:uncharacterized protein LOC115737650 isoform X2 [Rhodamnia argentea]
MSGVRLIVGSWQPAVPSWEKQFCQSVGSVPWRRLLEAKKYLHIHDKVVKWNDSAVEEAFHNAKDRYWEEINGLPCSISSPDPNIHIDEVDWESKVDPELLLDLERGPEAFYSSNSGPTIIFGDVFANPSFACDGWGDVEEEWAKDETSWKVNCVGGENVYGADPAEQVAIDADALWGSKQGQFQGRNQRVGTQEDSNVKDYARLENDKDRTVDNWDTWDWDKMNRELEPGGCENAHGVDSADQVAPGCDPFWGSNQGCSHGWTQKVSAQEDCGGKDYHKLENGYDGTGWDTWDGDNMNRENKHIGCGKTYGSDPVERITADGGPVWVSKQTHDNWDTWDWDKMNRELEPGRQYIPKHKREGFGRNDKQMRYGWSHGKGMKQNNFVY